MNDVVFSFLITPIGAVVICACLFWLTRRPSRELEEVEAALKVARAKLAQENLAREKLAQEKAGS